jgi:hypothetical protein
MGAGAQKAEARNSLAVLSTVRDFEKGERTPIANNLPAIRQAIEDSGITLIEENGRAIGIREKL